MSKHLHFYEIVAGADNSRAMESETIQKNGASPKSHMSRGNFGRKICLTLFASSVMICGLLFTGCSGGGTPSSVVSKAMEALIKKDAETVFKYYYNLSDYQKKELRDGLSRDSDYDLVKFGIQDERIFDNGEKAEVIVKGLCKNGSERTNKLSLVKTSNGWKLVQSF